VTRNKGRDDRCNDLELMMELFAILFGTAAGCGGA
jgi:hypothetical protein